MIQFIKDAFSNIFLCLKIFALITTCCVIGLILVSGVCSSAFAIIIFICILWFLLSIVELVS